jgi:hypothetical protein
MAVKKAVGKLKSAGKGIGVAIWTKEKIMRNAQAKARRPQ